MQYTCVLAHTAERVYSPHTTTMAKAQSKQAPRSQHTQAQRTAQQVRLPDIVRDALKRLAEREGVTLGEMYDEALRWFLRHEARRKTIFYLASSHAGGYVTMWFATKSLDRIRTVAERDRVPINRVTYTALVHYLQAQRVL